MANIEENLAKNENHKDSLIRRFWLGKLIQSKSDLSDLSKEQFYDIYSTCLSEGTSSLLCKQTGRVDFECIFDTFRWFG